MKTRVTSSLAWALTTAALGCAAPAQEPATSQVAFQSAALTLEDCADERDQCFAENQLAGLLTCPAQYAACAAAVAQGVSRDVAGAIADAADCQRKNLDCARSAEGNPVQLAVCAEDNAQCVAAIVDVDLPNVVEGTAACIEATANCINASETPRDIGNCGLKLEECAIKQVEGVVPPEVVAVVTGVAKCRSDLESCVDGAESPTALTTCTEHSVSCVATVLNVPLPDLPLTEAVACADKAANCALDAETPADIAECGNELRHCTATIVEGTDVPEQLSCEQKWTACLARGDTPADFLRCAASLAECAD